MNLIAEQIKELVSMQDIFEKYGFKTNRAGKIVCPFHTEKTASLGVKNNMWHCFGCGKGGSAIDFVMELFHLDFLDAIKRINEDFGLGLDLEKPKKSSEISYEIKKRRQEKKLKEDFINWIWDYRNQLAAEKWNNPLRTREDYVKAAIIEYHFDILESDNPKLIMELYKAVRK